MAKKEAVIKPCSCTGDTHGNPQSAQFQDQKYGKGLRVHTVGGGSKSIHYTCTICGRVK